MFRSVLRTSTVRAAFAPRIATFSTSRIIANSISHKVSKGSHVYKYLEEGPKSVKYTAEHEWLASFADESGFVGITQYASEALGDVTFVELPEVGDRVEIGDTIGSVESVKSASEIYSPVAGEIVAVNTALESEPSLINTDPIGEGWIAHIKYDDASAVEASEELLSEEDYDASLEEH
ncbi:H-protein subunit of glycine cleavage system [Scheffersomyces xylosifermentans]|uniref:H-protein subunit of glycine cleavage system n=1 Tax=Scheffersomyces xylosifermentans TaxID=1304137 RepID=UPI00315D1B6D